MKIMLISGHGAGDPGAGDPGAVATIGGKYYQECDLTVEVVDALAPILKNRYGVDVYVYDKKRNAYTDYKNGVLGLLPVDYLLEIHFNAGVKDFSGNGITTGTEIYYPSRGKKSGAESAILSFVSRLGLKNRGEKSGQFAVINSAAARNIPANLLEVCFIDDADDMRLYLSKKNAFAEAIAAGIAEAFSLKPQDEKPNELPWYIKSGEWADATKLGLVDGTRPDDKTTRAETAAIVLRAMDIIRKERN